MDGTLAQVIMFAGNFAPRNWMYCHGQLLPISSNSALFSLIGTIYGGDGRTTFQLPDLRGRVPIGAGQGPGLSDYRLGARGGAEIVTLNTTQIPSHDHTTTINNINLTVDAVLKVSDNTGNSSAAKNNALAKTAKDLQTGHTIEMYDSNPTYTKGFELKGLVATGSGTGTGTIGNTGGSQPHENRQPWLAINYVICTQGLFPSRN